VGRETRGRLEGQGENVDGEGWGGKGGIMKEEEEWVRGMGWGGRCDCVSSCYDTMVRDVAGSRGGDKPACTFT